MALPKLDIEIGADASGAVRGMRETSEATKRLQKELGITINTSGKLVDKFNQTVRVTRDLEKRLDKAGISTDDLARDMTEARTAADRMGNELREAAAAAQRMKGAVNDNAGAVGKAAATSTRLSRRLSNATTGNRAFGRSVQNMSFQVGDFATQVGAGTSASIALGQQLPQLLGGFGVLGAAIGAVVAIGVPLARVMGEMADSGKDMTSIFGTLAPVAKAVGEGLSSIKTALFSVMEAVISNLDRLLISAGLVATFFATKWVASFVAAKFATLSLVGALALLKRALITTGIGAVIIGAGVLIERFLALSRAAGSFGQAFDLVARAIGKSFEVVGLEIEQFWVGVLANLAKVQAMIAGMFDDDAAASLEETAANFEARWVAIGSEIRGANQEFDAMAGKIAGLLSQSERGFKFGSLSKGEEGDGTGAASEDEKASAEEAAREELQAKLDRVREGLLTENQIIHKALLDKLAIMDEARANELVSEQEHQEARTALLKKHADNQAKIEEAKKRTLTSNTATMFGAMARLAEQGGKKTAGLAKAFGIAEAIINTFAGATRAFKDHAFPQSAIIASTVIAAGLANVASIARVNANGGANSAPAGGGGGAAAAAAAPKPLDVMVQGLAPDDLISGGQLSSLFDKLVDEAGDRGIRPVFAT